MKTYHLIIEPKNQDQWAAIKAFLAALNVKHKVDAVPAEMTETEYYKMIEDRVQQVEDGKTVEYTPALKKDLFE